MSQIFAQFETQHLSASQLMINGGNAALHVNTLCVHRSTGAQLDTKKHHVWSIEEGWPTELDEHYDVERFRSFMQSMTRKPTHA